MKLNRVFSYLMLVVILAGMLVACGPAATAQPSEPAQPAQPAATEAPAASVRDSLLAEAAHVRSRSALGPSIPALAHGLHESLADADQPSVNRLSVFLEQAGTEKWLMMILPVYAIR